MPSADAAPDGGLRVSARVVDAVLDAPALVFGSLPPDGRDLDLLVRSADVGAVHAALRDAGWVRRGRTYAGFADGTAYAVEVVALDDWVPSSAAGRRLWDAAGPLDGYAHLRAPAPHHRLLVLARRYRDGMRPDERKRRALAAFDEADWAAAAAEARDWGCAAALVALSALPGRGGATPASASNAPTATVPPRRRRGSPQVVALSGLDGSGKSTQAEALRTALEALGYDVAVEWTKIARNPGLASVARPVKAVLVRVSRGGPPAASPPPVPEDDDGEVRTYPGDPPEPPDAGSLARRQNPALTWGWTFVVAWANAWTHRALVRGRHEDVVICDRYVLDSRVHLRYRYGPERRFRLQGALLRSVSPRATSAFLLDVAPSTARARKPEQYTTRELTQLRGLYREEAGRLGVHRVDGEQPEADVAAEVARRTWQALAGTSRPGSARRVLRAARRRASRPR